MADNKIEYLMQLELPFFIGVVSQSPTEMKVYSAEFLPLLFSDFGPPERLALVPVEEQLFDSNKYFEHKANRDVRLFCPLVTTLTAADNREALLPKAAILLSICTRTLGNIATRLSEEHIYKVDDKGNFRIVAGQGSAKFFRLNFIKRLGEVFQNFNYILGHIPPDATLAAEIQVYESLYHELETLDGYGPTLPTFVSVPYRELQEKMTRLLSRSGTDRKR